MTYLVTYRFGRMRLYSYEVDRGITTMQSTLTSSQQKLTRNHCRGDEFPTQILDRDKESSSFLKKTIDNGFAYWIIKTNHEKQHSPITSIQSSFDTGCTILIDRSISHPSGTPHCNPPEGCCADADTDASSNADTDTRAALKRLHKCHHGHTCPNFYKQPDPVHTEYALVHSIIPMLQ